MLSKQVGHLVGLLKVIITFLLCSDSVVMIDMRLLFFWPSDLSNDTSVSSCSSGEFLENRATVAFVTLEAAVQSVGSILILESIAGILTIDGSVALVWSTVINIKNLLIGHNIWET